MHTYISKHNQLNLYNVTCVHNFRNNILISDNHLVCYSLGKTISPILKIPLLLIVLYVGLRPCEVFTILFGMSIGVFLVQLTEDISEENHLKYKDLPMNYIMGIVLSWYN